MAEELGKIEKPAAEEYKKGRKLYIVPLIFSAESSPPEYIEKYQLYWQQVDEHITNLESKLGTISRIYHEMITDGGDGGFEVLEKLNDLSCKLSRGCCQKGAVLEATEFKTLLDESFDWERCMLLGFISQKVAVTVSELYRNASRKRYEHIAKRIDETLKENEAGILVIREGHSIQFTDDIQVFSVMPPALDEIHRWLRDRTSATKDENKDGDSEPEK